VVLHLIGCGALMLQTNYERGTKDADVLELGDLHGPAKDRLLALGGKESELHRQHLVYLDVVGNGVPFLPLRPVWRAKPSLQESLAHFEVRVLDVVDVVVSKLKRFHANDQADILAMVNLGLVSHAALVSRFVSAVDRWSCDARAEDFPRYVRNLHRVERDMLGVEETEIELPDWI
jgi:hypothetical protein